MSGEADAWTAGGGGRDGNVRGVASRGRMMMGAARTHAHGRAYDATLEAVPVRRPAHRATGARD